VLSTNQRSRSHLVLFFPPKHKSLEGPCRSFWWCLHESLKAQGRWHWGSRKTCMEQLVKKVPGEESGSCQSGQTSYHWDFIGTVSFCPHNHPVRMELWSPVYRHRHCSSAWPSHTESPTGQMAELGLEASSECQGQDLCSKLLARPSFIQNPLEVF
jgi:hypothetical protein